MEAKYRIYALSLEVFHFYPIFPIVFGYFAMLESKGSAQKYTDTHARTFFGRPKSGEHGKRTIFRLYISRQNIFRHLLSLSLFLFVFFLSVVFLLLSSMLVLK